MSETPPEYGVLIETDGNIRGVIPMKTAGIGLFVQGTACRTCGQHPREEYERAGRTVDGTAWIYERVVR